MAKQTTDPEATIEALLEQRSQYEEWILRLDTSGDKASPAVRQRVRGDYEARLESVMEQLRGRSAAIAEELERQHASQAELDRERRSAEEALAEAEVRHTVGEYTEDEWRRLSEQSRKNIEQLRSRLRGSDWRSPGSLRSRQHRVSARWSSSRPAAAGPTCSDAQTGDHRAVALRHPPRGRAGAAGAHTTTPCGAASLAGR